jgi:hypothetical protein
MKTYNKCLIVTALLGLTLALPYRLSAVPVQQTFHFKFVGRPGEAVFDSFDLSGCVETFIYLQAVDGRIKQIGRPQVSSSASVFISQTDNCTQAQLIAASGSATLEDAAFQIPKDLTSAALNTTIEVFDFVSNTSFPVDISVNWVATGEAVNERDHFMLRVGGFRINSSFAGTFRGATASGSVTAGGTNFSPNSAVFADLSAVKSGELDVVH